ncbi:MAG: ASCH domain-containing protein [Bacilli bacterium]
MKVITIKEPWATLIINGLKEYEFRTWKTNYRGEILIHTSKKVDQEALKKFEDLNLNYQTSKIIGKVSIIDCKLIDDKFDKELSKSIVHNSSSKIGKYAWVLKDPQPLINNKEVKGRLGIWNIELK